MNSTKQRIALLASTATLAGAGMAATAQAEPVGVVGGETELTLNKKTAETLETLEVTAKGTAYEVKGGEYDFAPLDEGGGGVLKHKGTLTLKTDEAKAKLKNFVIELSGAETQRAKDDDGVLTAKIGDERVEVGRLNTRKYESDEKNSSFAGLRVELSKEAAKVLNETFDVDEFEEGTKLGILDNQSEVEEVK